jgi:hypothetical protein
MGYLSGWGRDEFGLLPPCPTPTNYRIAPLPAIEKMEKTFIFP